MERVVLTNEEVNILKNKGCEIGGEAQDIELEDEEVKQAKQYIDNVYDVQYKKTPEGVADRYQRLRLRVEQLKENSITVPTYVTNDIISLKKLVEIANIIKQNEYFKYESCPIEIHDGYEYLVLEQGILFYKALTWFFDKHSTTTRMWVGDIRIVYLYYLQYYVGLMVYRNKERIISFILNDQNLQRMYDDSKTPEDIREILRWMFGIDTPIERQVEYFCKPVWFHQKTICDDTADVRRYSALVGSRFRAVQHKLFDYIERQFKCRSTYLRITTGPFSICNPTEITIQPQCVEQRIDHYMSWPSYGYIDVHKYQNFIPKASITNINFNAFKWLEESDLSYEAPQITHALQITHDRRDIIFADLQNLATMFETYDSDKMLDSFCHYVQKWRPKILAVAHISKQYTQAIKHRIGYRHCISTANGAQDYDMELAVYSNEKLNSAIGKYRDKFNGNFITLKLPAAKISIICSNIKPLSLNVVKFNDQFLEVYNKGKKLLMRFFDVIIAHNPDVIIGRVPCLDVYSSIVQNITQHGYSLQQFETDFNRTQSHWIINKKDYSGICSTCPWVMSHSRPISYVANKNIFDGQSLRVHGANESYEAIAIKPFIITIIIIIIIIVIIIFNILYTVVECCRCLPATLPSQALSAFSRAQFTPIL